MKNPFEGPQREAEKSEEIEGLSDLKRKLREVQSDIDEALQRKNRVPDGALASYCSHLMRNIGIDMAGPLREYAALPSQADRKELSRF